MQNAVTLIVGGLPNVKFGGLEGIRTMGTDIHPPNDDDILTRMITRLKEILQNPGLVDPNRQVC